MIYPQECGSAPEAGGVKGQNLSTTSEGSTALRTHWENNDLDSFDSTGQVVAQMPPYWNLFGVFLVVRLGDMYSWADDLRDKVQFSSHCIKYTY